MQPHALITLTDGQMDGRTDTQTNRHTYSQYYIDRATRIGRRCTILNCFPLTLFITLSSSFHHFQSLGGWVKGQTLPKEKKGQKFTKTLALIIHNVDNYSFYKIQPAKKSKILKLVVKFMK